MDRVTPLTERQKTALYNAACALWALQAAFEGDERPWIQNIIRTIDAVRFCKFGVSPRTGKPLKR